MAAYYPLTGFHFTVEWGGQRLGFTEVSGLDDVELEVVSYREGDSQAYHDTKFPGRPKYADITLKRGMLKGDDDFSVWLSTVKMNQIERRDLTINLLDEEHNPVFSWQVSQAWPTKLTGPSLNSTGNDVAVEEISLANEGVKRVAV